ncbi:hypothetical protein GQ54DRAFT_242947, partial [Martensiomyces pterosporus]
HTNMPTMAPDNSTPDGTKLSAPKRIIRSVCSYSARTNKELSFDKGEFFHVVDHEDDPRWYDACNPLTGKRGLVPVSHFEIMESRQERIRRIQRSSSSRKLSQQGLGFPSTPQPSAMQLYGTVLYDFEAENSDETTVRADEPVLVVAQSTADWFVVKPAMRAAAPGLVPVSYIRLRDHVTGGPVDDLQAYLSRYHVRLPSVAEWKKKSL